MPERLLLFVSGCATIVVLLQVLKPPHGRGHWFDPSTAHQPPENKHIFLLVTEAGSTVVVYFCPLTDRGTQRDGTAETATKPDSA